TAYNYFDSPFSTSSLASTSTSSDTDHRLSNIERKFDSILKRLKRPEESGVNLLDVEATDPSKYTLTLMDTLFTDDELSSCCYIASKRTAKPGLDKNKVKLLEKCIIEKFGYEKFAKVMKAKCMQKCTDRANKGKAIGASSMK
uniref:BEN domain-containing protein n=1 Tax=Amphimedon queenslandica TaxID=400682 RepID=A0A1X7SP61_AMPQE